MVFVGYDSWFMMVIFKQVFLQVGMSLFSYSVTVINIFISVISNYNQKAIEKLLTYGFKKSNNLFYNKIRI